MSFLLSIYKIALNRPTLEIYHDIYDKVMLILTRRISSDNKNMNDNVNLETIFKRPKSSSQKLDVINKDIEDALSLLQAGSIMMRVKSGKK